jgi:tight adherence protein C
MILILLLGIALTGCAVWLVFRAVGYRRLRVAETVRGMDAYGFRDKAPAPAIGQRPLTEAFDRFAVSLGDLVATHTGLVREDEMRKLLRSAGMYETTPRKFMGYRVLGGIGLPALWLWLGISGGYSPIRMLFGLAVAVYLGWQGPIVFVRRQARMRLEEIDYQMPELIDILVTTIEAGVGFSGSLQLAARRLTGPLGDELRLTLQEQDMGLSTAEALANLLERCDTPSMRTFVRAVTQGETLGVSIGHIMRDLAVEMRKNRRQKAEERAQKAPTKILFPLVFLIFPAMFVVILGPAVIEIVRSLRGI